MSRCILLILSFFILENDLLLLLWENNTSPFLNIVLCGCLLGEFWNKNKDYWLKIWVIIGVWMITQEYYIWYKTDIGQVLLEKTRACQSEFLFH